MISNDFWCLAEASQQKSSEPLTPTSTTLIMSPFKTTQKTHKKGDEKKTEPTVADPSATSLPKNSDKVKGLSTLLNLRDLLLLNGTFTKKE